MNFGSYYTAKNIMNINTLIIPVPGVLSFRIIYDNNSIGNFYFKILPTANPIIHNIEFPNQLVEVNS
jgi:hypothetical protein